MKRLLCALLAALLLCGCTAAPAGTTEPAGPVLKAGFYLPTAEELEGTLLYIQLREDGTGCTSVMGMTKELTWTPAGAEFGDMTITPPAAACWQIMRPLNLSARACPRATCPTRPHRESGWPAVWVRTGMCPSTARLPKKTDGSS